MSAEGPIISTSDLHHDVKNLNSVKETVEIVESIGERKPRLVLLAGDMFEGGEDSAKSLGRILERLTKHGVPVVAVAGNEEFDPRKVDVNTFTMNVLRGVYSASEVVLLDREIYELREEGSDTPSHVVLGYMGSANGSFYNGNDDNTKRRNVALAESTEETREADLAFLRANLATAPSGKTTVLTHYGPFAEMAWSRRKTNMTFGGTVEYGDAMLKSGKELVVVHGHLLEAHHHKKIDGLDVYCVAKQVSSFDLTTGKRKPGVENQYTIHPFYK